MGYDRGDSFPFDFEPNGFPFGLKSKGKLSPWSYPIQFERIWKYSLISVVSPGIRLELHVGAPLKLSRHHGTHHGYVDLIMDGRGAEFPPIMPIDVCLSSGRSEKVQSGSCVLAPANCSSCGYASFFYNYYIIGVKIPRKLHKLCSVWLCVKKIHIVVVIRRSSPPYCKYVISKNVIFCKFLMCTYDKFQLHCDEDFVLGL